VTVLGCSLFSSISPEAWVNDFFQTDDWDMEAHNAAHERDLAWLNAQVADLEGTDTKIVILTHWSPSTDARSIDPKHDASDISSAFSTDLSDQLCFKSCNVKLWAFGHTHYNCDFRVERGEGVEPLRLLANQRGYYFAQAEGFDGVKTVNV